MSVPMTMSKGERTDLMALIRRREKLQKTAATQRSAELLADVERQLSAEFSYDQDDIWKQAHAAADSAVIEAQAVIHQRCRELGIPDKFAPSISMGWYGRGENASLQRRTELRRLAQARIEAIEKQARTEIEAASIGLQEKIVTAALTTDAAKIFLEQMPSVTTLMPLIDARTLIAASTPSRQGGQP